MILVNNWFSIINETKVQKNFYKKIPQLPAGFFNTYSEQIISSQP